MLNADSNSSGSDVQEKKIIKSRINLKAIPVIAFLIALELVLTRFLSINTPIIRIGFGFLPVSLCALIYGPLWSAVAYAIGDVIGALLFPSGAFFPGFTLTAFLTGLTFGLFLYRKKDLTHKLTWLNVLPASLIVCFVLNLGLDTLWLSMLMGDGFWGLMPARIPKAFIMCAVQVLLIPFIWNRLAPVIKKIIQ